ncbi:polysaccharide deacetylase family protein [Paenibacillus sp. J2TS4]|uniref:polysaccharide deacetylase family protein n=1 Tax=Paenibacillus sp. J2TS4 TaxID=2807194 RepID=UPI001B13003C|nr:polysaccharide deacetylase family protein [Paenibacillus sp. J2TS4]GIP33120.1 hypothetical protein J2TS4_23300 [Paenibacillus sp. J2TS4]
MRNKKRLASVIAGMGALVFALCQQPFMHVYFENVKGRQGPEAMPVFNQQGSAAQVSLKDKATAQERMDAIRREAARLHIPPIDAKLDRVWKAIPGYNGREVDVDRSFQLSKDWIPGQKLPLVFREIPPKITLDDLGAHPIYKGNPNKPMVSLMINVAWGNEFIPGMLETLERENVKATFFLDGKWLSKNVEMAKVIASKGHEMSNHAYSHKNMSGLGRAEAIQEIVKTENLLKEHLGVENKLFAPPSGDFNQQTVKIAAELNLRTVLWTIDTVDWKKPSPQTIITKIANRLEPGAMILMHPTESASLSLPEMIREIKSRDLVLGTVSELLSTDRVPENES